MSPARRGAWLRLQRHEGGDWRTVAESRLGASGRYAITAPARGTYRVVVGEDAGPSVVVR